MTNVKLSTHPKFVNITGNRYERMLVINYAGDRKWLCRCDCGAEKLAASSDLKRGFIKSCGCLSKENTSRIFSTHKKSKTPEYQIWFGMKKRCVNPKSKSYKDYGGRGITVCDKWLKFEGFYEDMGERPSQKHSIERIDVNGNYELNNCKWATAIEQGNNRRKTIYVIFNGQRMTLANACRERNISYHTVYDRFVNGCSLEYAISVAGRAKYGKQ